MIIIIDSYLLGSKNWMHISSDDERRHRICFLTIHGTLSNPTFTFTEIPLTRENNTADFLWYKQLSFSSLNVGL
jgi:hypothetical protein